ncbi:MAG: response regulator transcription factor [Bacteriovoracaceae bacterium]|jgi:DNA-binding response OmpR family regulator|nr:response regulator transcription factor [Bacteriovoracaceae bacterium]
MNKKTILIVEDNEDIGELLCAHLKTEGFNFILKTTAEDAVDFIEDDSIDLFILDWMLPGISGVELCSKIRTSQINFNKPIIMLTARSDSKSTIEGLDSGANDYISKPFDLNELSARIRAQLRSNQKGNLHILTFKELSIDTKAFEVFVADKRVRLTKSEYILLKTLLENKNSALARKDLIKVIQGDETVVTDRTIDTHMAGLRKKISPYGDQIKTVRGIGYKFED